MAQYIDLSARRSSTPKRADGLLAAQGAAALLVAAAGAIHLYLWFDYFHRVHVVGALFLLNAASGLALGAALLARRNVLVLLMAGGYAAGTLVAFVISTRWGLFGYRETFWGSWQEAAGGVELAAASVVAFLLARLR
ncbi:MAG TPA: hypothetical protein VJ838_10045 [Gaiellaceae bacterium]|jgi:hypothetical protein|nr:hypothetical protein [Gaiellaceae bacterium]